MTINPTVRSIGVQGAQVISFVFHPLFLCLYSYLFILVFHPHLFNNINLQGQRNLAIIIAMNTIFFPFITLFLMKKLDFISSLYMRERTERTIPYIAMSIFYFWNYMAVKNLGVHDTFVTFLLGASLSIFMAFFINLFYKISIHTVGAGNFLGVTLSLAMMSTYNLEVQVIIVILVAGLIGSSRLLLRAHRANDIYSGYMVGMLGQVLATFF